MLRPTIALLLCTAALAAGCISPPEDEAEAASVPAELPPAEAAGTMTIDDESDETTDDVCLLESGIQVPDMRPYCARRVVSVAGSISLTTLPVIVSVGGADVDASTSDPGEWSLRVQIVGFGATPEEARAKTQTHQVEYGIGQPGLHALSVVDRSDGDSAASVKIVLALPAATLYSFDVSTGSGDVDLSGLRTASTTIDVGSGDVTLSKWLATALTLTGGSSDVSLDVDASVVSIDRGSGDVSGTIRPIGTGTVEVTAGSGDVSLKLPEDRTHGYDVLVSTGSGDGDVQLKDGQKTSDEDEARFVTTGFGARPVRTTVVVSTGSGDVLVGPA